MLFKEHFIVAFAPNETVSSAGWTDWERDQIVAFRWWQADELRNSNENIFPRNLGVLLEPILAGAYPSAPIKLPPI